MRYQATWGLALLGLWACSDHAAPAAAPPGSPSITPAPQATPPTAPPVSPPAAPNPCDNPAPIMLELAAGAKQPTPWDIQFRYVPDEDKKRGSGFMFQLHSGDRRWETRRDNTNWTRQLTWRGFCWRGAERFAPRALRLKIQIAPVCKDGKLQELGGCGTALGSR